MAPFIIHNELLKIVIVVLQTIERQQSQSSAHPLKAVVEKNRVEYAGRAESLPWPTLPLFIQTYKQGGSER